MQRTGIWLVVLVLLLIVGLTDGRATVDPGLVPSYVEEGLQLYQQQGYEAAVHRWLADSPYQSAATLAANIAFFKNIEMLAGNYQSFELLMTKETQSSNVVYVRLNYERLPGYILFTSILKNGNWVLGKIQLDRQQRFGTLP